MQEPSCNSYWYLCIKLRLRTHQKEIRIKNKNKVIQCMVKCADDKFFPEILKTKTETWKLP